MEFSLRPFTLLDAESILRYANNKKIADNLRNGFPYPYTSEDTLNFLHACLDRDESKSFVRAIEVAGEAVGSIVSSAETMFTLKAQKSGTGWANRSGAKVSSAERLRGCAGKRLPVMTSSVFTQNRMPTIPVRDVHWKKRDSRWKELRKTVCIKTGLFMIHACMRC